MIDEQNRKIIENHLKHHNTYNVRFKNRNVEIILSFNDILHSNNNYVIHCRETNSANPKVYINFMKYNDNFIEFNKNFLGYKYDKNIKNYFLHAFIDENGKLNEFWQNINDNIRIGNYFNQDVILTYNLNNHSTNGKGIYLLTKIHKNMSKEHYNYLRRYFNIPPKNLQLLQKNGWTIGTTNDIRKSQRHSNEWKQYYNDDFKIW